MEEANRGLREEVEVEVVINDHVLKEEWQLTNRKICKKFRQTDRQIDGKNCRLIR